MAPHLWCGWPILRPRRDARAGTSTQPVAFAFVMDPETRSSSRISRVAWATLVVAVITIVSGDIVQATESGAGCGESWPRCDGSLLPGIGDAATAIEFTHRMLTVALTAAVVALLVVVFRSRPRGDALRRPAGWVGGFLLLEVLIGAALVIFGWVEDDASVGRVVADGFHVVNTFFLIGAAVLTVFVAGRGRPRALFGRRQPDRILALGAAVLVIVAISGAINSLADALFPHDSVLEGLRAEFGATAPFLVRMRVLHPVIAVAGGTAVFMIVRSLPVAGKFARRAASVVLATIGVQFVAGILNVAFLTPLEIQVVHLLLADLLWISYLFLGFEMLRTTPASGPQASAPAGEVAV